MRIFVYKTLFIFVCIFIIFQLTVGAQIKKIKYELEKFKSQENIALMKNKLRIEMQNAINKDNYLSREDANLINEFINKIKKELSN